MNKFLFIFIVVFYACDKVEPPFKDNINNNNTIDTNTFYSNQKILIEEFTGHRCGNCPRAHEMIDTLKKIYGNRIIAVSIHAGFFAQPLPPDYPADYRTVEGDELYNFFGVQSTPIGIINRKKIKDSYLIEYENWSSVVAEIINENPPFLINVTSSFNSDTSVIFAKVILKIKNNILSNVRLSAFLVEDSIISAQTDYSHLPTLIPDYVHKNVLRASFNGTWGIDINITSKNIGDTIIKNMSLPVRTTWNLKNCKIVTFVYDFTTLCVYQVEEKKLLNK